jgi:hypothetical protein
MYVCNGIKIDVKLSSGYFKETGIEEGRKIVFKYICL